MYKYIIPLLMLATTSHAFDNSQNNTMIKECLDAYGYNKEAPIEKRLNNFDWRSASNCVSNFNLAEQKQKVAEQREFLKKNPWYKGKNWQWEMRTEYTCNKVYTNAGPVEVCSRPYYIN